MVVLVIVVLAQCGRERRTRGECLARDGGRGTERRATARSRRAGLRLKCSLCSCLQGRGVKMSGKPARTMGDVTKCPAEGVVDSDVLVSQTGASSHRARGDHPPTPPSRDSARHRLRVGFCGSANLLSSAARIIASHTHTKLLDQNMATHVSASVTFNTDIRKSRRPWTWHMQGSCIQTYYLYFL